MFTMRNRLYAKTMRSAPTYNEARLWAALRNRRLAGLKFRRQVPIDNYIADFLCIEARLIVEADGPIHDPDYDKTRDGRLRAAGYRVLRFTNRQIEDQLPSVLATICVAAGRQPSDDGAALIRPPSGATFSRQAGEGSS